MASKKRSTKVDFHYYVVVKQTSLFYLLGKLIIKIILTSFTVLINVCDYYVNVRRQLTKLFYCGKFTLS